MIRLARFLRTRRWAACALALFAAPPGGAGAQAHLLVRSEPGTPVVAMEVLVAAGPADEAPEQAGLAYLTARAATAPVRPILDSLGARLTVQAYKDALSFTLIAAPDTWNAASRTLLVALFRDPADSVATLRERGAIRAELVGREASPADALAREVDAAVFGPDHPWGRPAVGYSSTVETLTVTDVDNFLRTYLVPERSVVAVMGPVDEARTRDHLGVFFTGGSWRIPEAAPPTPLESAVRRDYNSITTWIAASYRFPVDADEEAIRLLADLAVEGLSFDPSRRSVYNARSEVLRRIGGGELRLQIVVPPGEVEAWAPRLHAAIARYAEQPLAPSMLADRVRRHRGRRLRELDTPEARAQAAARGLLLGRVPSARLAELERLNADRLQAAARLLGEPTLVFLGPFLDSSDSSTRASTR
ncbi:MAG TPA: hypothetical protein VHG28_05315 [Longimicrobiaceae bacterium]|nr:hypothetical protein [Longimicrobiaceae bacterium]